MKIIIFIIFLLFYNNAFSTKPDCKLIEFDFLNHEDERKKIIDFEDLHEFEEKNEIGISYFDLNNDRTNEILAKICNIVLFGSNECIIRIYTIEDNNYKPTEINVNFDLCISNAMTNNYFDIYSTIKNTNIDNTKQYFEYRLFKFNEKSYVD